MPSSPILLSAVDRGSIMRMPNWLRWILFFPGGLLALTAVYSAVLVGNRLFYEGFRLPFIEYVFIVVAAGASAYSFVWSGAKIAPNHHFRVSVIMTVIYGFFAGFVVVSKLFMGNNTSVSWFEAFAMTAAGIIGAISACNKFHEEATKTTDYHIDL